MSKGRGGDGKPVRKPIKQLSAIARIEKKSRLQLAEQFRHITKSTVDPEQLRVLRHFRPAYLRTMLSQGLQVGEGRSRLYL